MAYKYSCHKWKTWSTDQCQWTVTGEEQPLTSRATVEQRVAAADWSSAAVTETGFSQALYSSSSRSASNNINTYQRHESQATGDVLMAVFQENLDNRSLWFSSCSISQHTQQRFYCPLSGTTRVSQYQKKHSPTHHPDHHPIFISFFHLPRSIASSLFKLHAWQSFCTTSFHVLFGLPLGLPALFLQENPWDKLHRFLKSRTPFRSLNQQCHRTGGDAKHWPQPVTHPQLFCIHHQTHNLRQLYDASHKQ